MSLLKPVQVHWQPRQVYRANLWGVYLASGTPEPQVTRRSPARNAEREPESPPEWRLESGCGVRQESAAPCCCPTDSLVSGQAQPVNGYAAKPPGMKTSPGIYPRAGRGRGA